MMYAHPGKKLLFMGAEFGQWYEWNCYDSLQWHLLDEPCHRQIQQCLSDLNSIYAANGSLHQVDFSWEGFEWIDLHDTEQSIVSFVRRGKDPADLMICVFNFTPVPREGYRVGVPWACSYDVLMNTDDLRYGGSGVSEGPVIQGEDLPWQGQKASVQMTLPPLGAVLLKPGAV
jgi:1,4-alpha-glucan branching enzyme